MSTPTQDIFDRVLLRPADGPAAHRALLTWRCAGLADRAVQVYVNAALYDIIIDPQQRELWLHLDRTTDTVVELLAVDASDAARDHSALLQSWQPAFVSSASLAVLKDIALPVDSRAIVSIDGEDAAEASLWGAGDSRAGFGGLHGIGEFGRDHATAPGSGLAEFGLGAMGADGSAWRWRNDDLPAGDHDLSVRVVDGSGAVVGQLDAPAPVQIDLPPSPPRNLQIDDQFNLQWNA